MTVDKDGNNMPPSTAERGDILRAMKEYARQGYMASVGGTEEEFEQLWLSAFFAEDVRLSSED